MKKLWCLLLVFLTIGMTGCENYSLSKSYENYQYRILQYNLEAESICGVYASSRIDGLQQVMQALEPDICVFNECDSGWKNAIWSSKSFNDSYTPIKGCAWNEIFYKTDRFCLQKSSLINFADGTNRNLLYAILIDINTQKQLVIIATHWNHSSGYQQDEAEQLRTKNATRTVKEIQKLKELYPDGSLILAGDLNCQNTKDLEEFKKTYLKTFKDGSIEKEFFSNEKTATRFLDDETPLVCAKFIGDSVELDDKTSGCHSIDHVYLDPNQVEVLLYKKNVDLESTSTETSSNSSPAVSDHDPLYCDFVLKH